MRILILVVAVAVVIAGCGDSDDSPVATEASPQTLTVTAPSDTPTVPVSPTTALPATATTQPTAAATPTPFAGAVARLVVAELQVDIDVVALGLEPDRNVLESPPTGGVGWYDIYDRPGWGGHSLFTGWWRDGPGAPPGPFFEINERLSEGSIVVVEMEDGSTYTYEVYGLLDDPGVVAFIDPADRPDGETLALMSCPQVEGGVTCFGTLAARVDDEGAAD